MAFWRKVSSERDCDCLEFRVDGIQREATSGAEDWTQKTYTITTAGTHTIQWRYQKDGSISEGDDCGWVDAVQWSGPIAEDPPANDWGWTGYVYNAGLTYVYDASGRRIEKRCDGRTITKYVYDGDHCLAEYDASGNLRRKYIYGPGVDQPVCMIEATQSYAGTYYYHFDALGSVVALTNSSGNTVEVYEYSVYGQVGASDANHPNRFMFTGREFDKETGLYYYRARYYNPQIGRFLQTDPVGYKAGMNWYIYCQNNGVTWVDPTGLTQMRGVTLSWGTGYGGKRELCINWVLLGDDEDPDAFGLGIADLRKEGKYDFIVYGDAFQFSYLSAALNDLARLSSGEALLDEFAGSRYGTGIELGKIEGSGTGVGRQAGSYDPQYDMIAWDPFEWLGDPATNVDRTGARTDLIFQGAAQGSYNIVQPAISLGHELIHSWLNVGASSPGAAATPEEEEAWLDGVGGPDGSSLKYTETQLRKEWRDYYGAAAVWYIDPATGGGRWISVPMRPEERWW
ncbi:MAG: RHS repeat-associated core domain-containing protein [Phycisphaerae bacterium]|nr:RHS repeat-associated core domain-containing protein [Phycisphaerae bacterium]